MYSQNKIVKKQNIMTHKVYPLKVEKEENTNHSTFSLWKMINHNDYIYIKNF